MAERSSLNQVVQIGVESTPGTSVAATKRLLSIGIEPSPSVDMAQFRPAGYKYRTLTALNKEFVEANVTGQPTYTEIIYMLSSVLTAGVVTTPVGATSARQWLFTPSSTVDDAPKTYTIEHGSSVRADKFTYALFTELGLTISRNGIDMSGSLFGRSLTDGITLTSGGVTELPLVPILPTEFTVYMDSTSATLGTTKLTRVLSSEFHIGSRYGQVWVVDAANPSFITHIETEPDLTLNLTVEADSEGMALLNTLRDGGTKFVRLEAIGAEIDTGIAASKYRFTLDMAVKMADTGGFSDSDGVYAVEWNLVGVHDSTWGKALQVAVVNPQTAL